MMTVVGNCISRFMEKAIAIVQGNHGQVHVILNQDQYESTSFKRLGGVTYTFYNGNLPDCLVLGNDQLWFSSDTGFQRNSGMTIQFKQPAFIEQFQKMIAQSIRGLDL
ncbi:hypothetical protein ACPD8N_07430 [Lacticaseibacillus chiayiensis]|uniref:hypothetical protein n=1 Tax=Lacticaseibacillus chiayiensis TaxID=2100821 RepID=UPI003C7443EC